jgi:hypothetical protein
VKRLNLLDSLRNRLPVMPQLAPATGGLQVQFASAGGGGGRNDDDYPDDEYYDDELPDEEPEPAPRRQRQPARRATAARQRTVQTDPDDRYWTDYLRIALPVIGLLLVIAVFWYWAQQLIDDNSGDLTPTAQPGLAEIVDTPGGATEPPATPTQQAGILQPQGDGTPANPLQAFPSPTPAGEQPVAQETQPAATDNQAAAQATQAPASTGAIQPDMQVSVIDGPLNMRAEPSTSSDIVATLDTGAVLTVTGGPQEGENYVWWNVVDDQGNVGWVAEQFIQPAG